MDEPYYSFNSYLRKQFGCKVQRISLDAGFSCPNLDGSLSDKGCSYCNNKAFSVYAGKPVGIEEQIEKAILFYQEKAGIKKFVAYFQAFSNTYADCGLLKSKYDIIRKFPQIAGLFISTRPDCVDEDKLRLISRYKEDYLVWIEYGLQSTDDSILRAVNRGHTYADFINALALTRKYGINAAVHMIAGLPGASAASMKKDAENLSSLDIQGIKFHILSVFKDTALEELYNSGKIRVLGENEYVSAVCDYLEVIPAGVVVMRLVSGADSKYLIAPRWVNDKARVINAIKDELARRGTYQGSKYRATGSGRRVANEQL